jgi:SARP family transcriptional regulator, regulator of embCAB operon
MPAVTSSRKRSYLVEEVGVEPGDQLQQLHQRMFRNDPALASRHRPSSPALPPGSSTPTPYVPDPSPPLGTAFGSPLLGTPPTGPVAVGSIRSRPWFATAFAALVCLCTLGFATSAVVGYHAVRRRSLPLALAAVGYLVLVNGGLIEVDGAPEQVAGGGPIQQRPEPSSNSFRA